MIRLWIFICLLTNSHSWANAQEPWAVMTGQSVMEVRSGLRHIYQRLGRKDLVAAMDSAAVTNLVSGNLKGLDLTRPLGCVILPKSDGTGAIISFVPCTDAEAFRGFLKRHALAVTQDQSGRERVNVPLLGSVSLRFEQNYALFAFDEGDLQAKLPLLNQVIPENHRNVQLAATFYLERMPVEQRQVWQKRFQQGMNWLAPESKKDNRHLTETVGLPLLSGILNRLTNDARELTLLASADKKTDELWAKAVITPRPEVPWMAEIQSQAKQVKIELPVKWWGSLRGKTEEANQRALTTAFTNGASDKVVLSINGGTQLELKAQMSGSVLAYHAALDQGETKPRRERSRERTRRVRPPR